ncbi:MAG: hypothetical protein M3R67_05440 [Acidobacteriota bacterium]|nr:hypothetical protein [Acidobacteriota bacterium]
MLKAIKKVFFWNYARNTWQWDMLCVVILIFIFVTPKSWFDNSERRSSFPHQSPTASTVLVGPELVENAEDRGQLEQRVREFTGRNDIQVLAVRKVLGKDGKTRGYEVDIR